MCLFQLLTKCKTVLTTSLFETWPTSISPIRTANFRLSVIDILTTSSGRLISLNGGRVRSAIFTAFPSTDLQPNEIILDKKHNKRNKRRVEKRREFNYPSFGLMRFVHWIVWLIFFCFVLLTFDWNHSITISVGSFF